MLHLSDCLPSGGPPETKENKLGSILSAQRHHDTKPLLSQVIQMLTGLLACRLLQSLTSACRDNFRRKDGPMDFLRKKQSRVKGKGLDADTRVEDPDSLLSYCEILEF